MGATGLPHRPFLHEANQQWEVSIRRSGIEDEVEFLRQAFETGSRFAAMVEELKTNAL
ncbi:MAG: hypothetical protein R2911_26305 [Caldilineaceae bacterium]